MITIGYSDTRKLIFLFLHTLISSLDHQAYPGRDLFIGHRFTREAEEPDDRKRKNEAEYVNPSIRPAAVR